MYYKTTVDPRGVFGSCEVISIGSIQVTIPFQVLLNFSFIRPVSLWPELSEPWGGECPWVTTSDLV